MYSSWMITYMPKEVMAANADMDTIWKPSYEREATRRTI